MQLLKPSWPAGTNVTEQLPLVENQVTDRLSCTGVSVGPVACNMIIQSNMNQIMKSIE